jgi:hypothetical protein
MTDLVITKFAGGTGGSFTAPPVFPATNNSAVVIFPVVKKFPNLTTGPDYSVEFEVSSFSTFYLHPSQFPVCSFTGGTYLFHRLESGKGEPVAVDYSL